MLPWNFWEFSSVSGHDYPEIRPFLYLVHWKWRRNLDPFSVLVFSSDVFSRSPASTFVFLHHSYRRLWKQRTVHMPLYPSTPQRIPYASSKIYPRLLVFMLDIHLLPCFWIKGFHFYFAGAQREKISQRLFLSSKMQESVFWSLLFTRLFSCPIS